MSGWVEQLPSGRWRARYRDPSGAQHSASFPTRAQAKAHLATSTADLIRGDWIDPRAGMMSFAEWTVLWSAGRLVRPSTRATDNGRLRTHLLPTFGDWALVEITPLAVRQFVAELLTRRAPKTVRECHALLSTMLRDAVAEGLLRTNPCRGIRLPTGAASIARFLNPDQLATLFDAVDPHYRPLLVTAAGTGMRWGELAGLRPGLVDLTRRKLRVTETLTEVRGVLAVGPPKTPRSVRDITLPHQVLDAIAPLLAGAEDYVFTTETGCPMRRHNSGRRIWKPALAASLEHATRFHDLRHTHVSLLIAAGVPVKAIQERLGHTSIVTTMDRYGHLLATVDESVLAGLESLLPGSAPDAVVIPLRPKAR